MTYTPEMMPNASRRGRLNQMSARALRGSARRTVLLLERSLRRVSEADRHPVIGVHQADRDCEIHELALVECRPCGLVRSIRHTGLGNARHRFGPRKGATLTLVKEVPRFGPGLYQRQ